MRNTKKKSDLIKVTKLDVTRIIFFFFNITWPQIFKFVYSSHDAYVYYLSGAAFSDLKVFNDIVHEKLCQYNIHIVTRLF